MLPTTSYLIGGKPSTLSAHSIGRKPSTTAQVDQTSLFFFINNLIGSFDWREAYTIIIFFYNSIGLFNWQEAYNRINIIYNLTGSSTI
jgi:hypothetical protein